MIWFDSYETIHIAWLLWINGARGSRFPCLSSTISPAFFVISSFSFEFSDSKSSKIVVMLSIASSLRRFCGRLTASRAYVNDQKSYSCEFKTPKMPLESVAQQFNHLLTIYISLLDLHFISILKCLWLERASHDFIRNFIGRFRSHNENFSL